MAAVNNLVTGGIGPGATVPYLLTGGLDIGEAAAAEATPSPFKPAIDALFRNRFMSIAATYTPSGGSASSVRVIRSRPDDRFSIGGGSVVSGTQVLEARVSEVATPAEGDVFEIDGETFVVQGKPRRDGERLTWRIDAYPQP